MEQHRITWRSAEIEITFTPEKFGMVEHIELRTTNKEKLPVTETGYRSHFMPMGIVTAHGGAVAFVTAWLDHEAARSRWSSAVKMEQRSDEFVLTRQKNRGWPSGQPQVSKVF